MQRLYDSEINFSVSCFWDGGFTVIIGDDMNGCKYEGYAQTWRDVEEILTREALRLYPGRKFARRYGAAYWSRKLIEGMSRCGAHAMGYAIITEYF